jgi:hypothetical protein
LKPFGKWQRERERGRERESYGEMAQPSEEGEGRKGVFFQSHREKNGFMVRVFLLFDLWESDAKSHGQGRKEWTQVQKCREMQGFLPSMAKKVGHGGLNAQGNQSAQHFLSLSLSLDQSRVSPRKHHGF